LQASGAEAAALIAQLQSIDVDLVNELFRETTGAGGVTPGSDGALEPPDRVTVLATSGEAARWHSAGLTAIAAGQAGIIVLAGGQGTRLGFDRCAGTFLRDRDSVYLPRGGFMHADIVARLQAEG
jgi:UDP-N-acetylglucosamine/UDP-N-acetylgalactosamine diphosphorylase